MTEKTAHHIAAIIFLISIIMILFTLSKNDNFIRSATLTGPGGKTIIGDIRNGNTVTFDARDLLTDEEYENRIREIYEEAQSQKRKESADMLVYMHENTEPTTNFIEAKECMDWNTSSQITAHTLEAYSLTVNVSQEWVRVSQDIEGSLGEYNNKLRLVKGADITDPDAGIEFIVLDNKDQVTATPLSLHYLDDNLIEIDKYGEAFMYFDGVFTHSIDAEGPFKKLAFDEEVLDVSENNSIYAWVKESSQTREEDIVEIKRIVGSFRRCLKFLVPENIATQDQSYDDILIEANTTDFGSNVPKRDHNSSLKQTNKDVVIMHPPLLKKFRDIPPNRNIKADDKEGLTTIKNPRYDFELEYPIEWVAFPWSADLSFAQEGIRIQRRYPNGAFSSVIFGVRDDLATDSDNVTGKRELISISRENSDDVTYEYQKYFDGPFIEGRDLLHNDEFYQTYDRIRNNTEYLTDNNIIMVFMGGDLTESQKNQDFEVIGRIIKSFRLVEREI